MRETPKLTRLDTLLQSCDVGEDPVTASEEPGKL